MTAILADFVFFTLTAVLLRVSQGQAQQSSPFTFAPAAGDPAAQPMQNPSYTTDDSDYIDIPDFLR